MTHRRRTFVKTILGAQRGKGGQQMIKFVSRKSQAIVGARHHIFNVGAKKHERRANVRGFGNSIQY
jgi:hypothetical protein